MSISLRSALACPRRVADMMRTRNAGTIIPQRLSNSGSPPTVSCLRPPGSMQPRALPLYGSGWNVVALSRIKGIASVIAGISDLLVLKTTESPFGIFVRDKYTTLKEVDDRILSTSVDLSYEFAPIAIKSPMGGVHYPTESSMSVQLVHFIPHSQTEIAPGIVCDTTVPSKARKGRLETFASPRWLAKPQVSLEDPLNPADLGSAWESRLRALEEVTRFRPVRCKALKTYGLAASRIVSQGVSRKVGFFRHTRRK
ncbi:hypothetical protein C8J57DRAFT_1666850 [Mycena rebaudengoi]|nr:hypothetical protein C8J57DRAFT_1666850 [Mycena rebaudengoi]